MTSIGRFRYAIVLFSVVAATALAPMAAAEEGTNIPECVEMDGAASSGWPTNEEGEPWVWIDEFNHVYVFVPTEGTDGQNYYGTEVIVRCSLDCPPDSEIQAECLPD